MRIVVTGAAGFIGSHLSEALVSAGHEVTGIDAFIPYYPRDVKDGNLSELRRKPGFQLEELDLRTGDLASVLRGADAVVHEAAMPGLVASWTDVELYTSCNILAVHRLLEAVRETRVPRLLHISTSSVYGTNAVGPETMPLRPVSPYGVTKQAAENLVLAYVELFGLNASILRYFSMYGPRQRPDMAYHRFIEAMLDRRPITLYGDGQQSRSNTYISDGVAGTIRALEGAKPGEVYNIGGGTAITLADAVQTIAEQLEVEPEIRREPVRAGDQRHTAADTTKAERDFGYRATVTPTDGLGEQIAWHVARRREAVSA